MQTALLPVFLFFACALGLALVLLGLVRLTNPARTNLVKQMPYESGMDPIHDTRRRFTVRFHLVAIAFLVFDVELLFLYPWAVATRPAVARTPPSAVASAGLPAQSAAAQPGVVGIDAAVRAGWVANRHIVFWGAMLFIALLGLGFIYDWRHGVFRWR